MKIADAQLKQIYGHAKTTYPYECCGFLLGSFEDGGLVRQVRPATNQNEERTGRIFAVFAALAIGIGCLGLLGLASFSAEQKTREIGIRRVLGASTGGIMLLLSRDLLRWVALANLVAWPLAFFAMNNWLQNFSYRIGLSWLFFAMAGLVTLFIAWFSTSFQAFKAASTDPVSALKHE